MFLLSFIHNFYYNRQYLSSNSTKPPTFSLTTTVPRCKGIPSTHWSCCSTANPCQLGQGDCDSNSECAGTLVCGLNNCRADHSITGSNWDTIADCCIRK